MLTSFDRILRVFRSLAHCSVELRSLSCLNGTLSCFNVSSILSCCFCVSYLFIYYFWFSFEPFARFDCRLNKKKHMRSKICHLLGAILFSFTLSYCWHILVHLYTELCVYYLVPSIGFSMKKKTFWQLWESVNGHSHILMKEWYLFHKQNKKTDAQWRQKFHWAKNNNNHKTIRQFFLCIVVKTCNWLL